MIRYQLPVHSPLPVAAVGRALWAGLGGGAPAAGVVEALVAARFEAERVLLVDSGTTALALAMRLAAPGGGPIALPAYGCYNLATAADALPHEVLLYDVDPDILGPDEASLDRVMASGVAALVVAPLYGYPVAMDRVVEGCRRRGVVLIEDAAQHAGARWRGRPVGSFGDLSVVSFGRGKGVTAGRGGALLGRGAKWVAGIAEIDAGLPAPSLGGVEALKLGAQWLLARPGLYAVPASMPFLGLGETIYHRPWPAGRMSAAARGALGVTWGSEAQELATRKRNAAQLGRALERRSVLRSVTPVPGAEQGFLRLPAVGPRRGLSAGRRVGVMPGYPLSLSDLAGFGERVQNRSEPFSGARGLAEGLLTFPTHSLLGSGDLRRIEAWISGGVAA